MHIYLNILNCLFIVAFGECIWGSLSFLVKVYILGPIFGRGLSKSYHLWFYDACCVHELARREASADMGFP